MIAKKKVAACLMEQAAGINKLHIKPYQKDKSLSSLRMEIGEILFFGNRQHKAFWPLFDVMLRQYIDHRRVTL